MATPTTQEIQFRDPAGRLAADVAPGNELDGQRDMDGERMILNMGPSHPSTHGVLRVVLELDGETIVRADPDIGYLHRGDEKIAENMTYNQFVPYTDRLDYLAPRANNMAYAIAVERLPALELPARCPALLATHSGAGLSPASEQPAPRGAL